MQLGVFHSLAMTLTDKQRPRLLGNASSRGNRIFLHIYRLKLEKRRTETFTKFSLLHPENPYERIGELTMPIFVANGDNDLLIPIENSVELAKMPPMLIYIFI